MASNSHFTLDNRNSFIDKLLLKLENLGINPAELTIDHLGYQTNSSHDYDVVVNSLADKATQISESIVGGRRVGIYKMSEPLKYMDQTYSIFEIVEPKADQLVDSGWEHIEFIVPTSLEGFIDTYPHVDWDTSVIDRDEFPMLILHLGDGLRAKFPRLGVEKELARQGESVG